MSRIYVNLGTRAAASQRLSLFQAIDRSTDGDDDDDRESIFISRCELTYNTHRETHTQIVIHTAYSTYSDLDIFLIFLVVFTCCAVYGYCRNFVVTVGGALS